MFSVHRVVGLFAGWMKGMTHAPSGALSLALLRIVVPLLAIGTPEFRHGVLVANWDPSRFVVPEGLGWFVEHVPISPAIARALQVTGFASALFAVFGLRARFALLVLFGSCFYLYAVANLAGHVWKDLHLLWFLLLLAASPCDDVLADNAHVALLASGPRYTVPLAFVAALFAGIYFFPGVHKLARSGLDWALSDNLENQLRWKWLQHGSVPSFRVDRFPTLLRAGGLFVLVFELAAPVLFLCRRLRPFGLGLGLLFHLLSERIFSIPFASLWVCYVALVDPRPLAKWTLAFFREPDSGAPLTGGPTLSSTLVVGTLLLGGVIVQGARGQMESFPFACYPTFEWRAADRMPDLVVRAVEPSGQEIEVAHGRDASGYRTQRKWAELWRLAGVAGEVSPERLRAYYRAEAARVVERRVPNATSVRFYRVDRSVVPEDRGRPVVSRLLFELKLRA